MTKQDKESLITRISQMPKSKRKPAMLELGKLEWEVCANDVMYWLDPKQHPFDMVYVYTNERHPQHTCNLCADGLGHHFNKRQLHLERTHKIEAETEAELRAFFHEEPGTRPWTILPYMPPIIEQWKTKPLLAIQKSRDMMATWLVVCLYTHDTLYHYNRQNIFQSQNASKTLELVKRADFIYRNQPEFLRKVHPATFTIGNAKSGELLLPDLDSEILGFPQGAEQIRQYHPSGVFTDETAFQIQAAEGFAAIKPAIQAGGRYTGVSSANPSFFMHICRDTLDTLII